MDEEFMAANATENISDVEDSAAAVETPVEEEIQGTESEQEETEQSEVTEESPDTMADNDGDVTKTQAFSNRLKEMSDKRVDDFVKSMGFSNDYTGKPITTAKEYNDFIKQHEAAKAGKDPITEGRISSLEDELSEYKILSQDAQLLADKEKGTIYKEIRDECIGLVQYAKQQGIRGVDLNSAYSTVVSKNLPKLLEKARSTAVNESLKKINANKLASAGSLGESAENHIKSVSEMTSAEFAEYQKKVERMGHF